MFHTLVLCSTAYAANVFKVPNDNPNMQQFPALDVLVPINQAFMSKYDFSKVPKISINSPPGNIGPPNCTAVADQSTFGPKGSCLWSCGACLRFEQGDVNSCPNQYDFGLSFDDGPAPSTNQILDYLSSKDIRATFFVVGSRVKEHPSILKRIFEEGHQIGVHTWSHRALTTLTTEQIVSELEYTIEAIEEVTGARPTFVRPPFGDHDDRVRAIFQAMGLKVALWDFESDDWRLVNTPEFFPANSFQDRIYDRAILQQTRSTGMISLHHDLYKQAMDRTPNVLDRILETKMVPKSISECTGVSPYTDKSLVIPPSLSKVTSGPIAVTPPKNSANPFPLNLLFYALLSFACLFF